MVYRGHVRNGAIQLETETPLPEGAEVEVRVVAAEPSTECEDAVPTLFERLKPFVGVAEGLPPDFSANHDHYLYGTPKRS